jgi:hypothetical protein
VNKRELVTIIFPHHFIAKISISDLKDHTQLFKLISMYEARLNEANELGFDLESSGVQIVNPIDQECRTRQTEIPHHGETWGRENLPRQNNW